MKISIFFKSLSGETVFIFHRWSLDIVFTLVLKWRKSDDERIRNSNPIVSPLLKVRRCPSTNIICKGLLESTEIMTVGSEALFVNWVTMSTCQEPHRKEHLHAQSKLDEISIRRVGLSLEVVWSRANGEESTSLRSVL